MRFAVIASREKGLLNKTAFAKLNAMIDALRLPPAGAVRRNFRQFLSLVSRDKKARGAASRFLLVEGPGRLRAAEDLKPAALKKAFEGALK